MLGTWSLRHFERSLAPHARLRSAPAMRHRFDQIGKKILREALTPSGEVKSQLEVAAADAQAVDTWFEPAADREAERQRAGLLGRMARQPTMFEPFHDTPGIDDVRDCLRKQLTLDHGRVLEARKREQPRPPFPQLWVLSTGRPESVLVGYGLRAMAGWPVGFYEGQAAEALGVVVLRELPRERDTLLLRLMGAGAVLKEALAELGRLPADAWERQVAMPALIAARVQIPQDTPSEEEREILMSIDSVYEQWEQQVTEKGIERGLERGREQGRELEAKRTLHMLYEARFGTMPSAITATIEATHDTAKLEHWILLIATRSPEEFTAAVQAGASAPETKSESSS